MERDAARDGSTAGAGRLNAIEGLRAYLAFWVVSDHVLETCGFARSDLPHSLVWLRSGEYAVDVFVIVSGFVIFSLLSRRKETPQAFITRRFFRLYPLMILLFLASIPLSRLSLWNAQHANFFHADYVHLLTEDVHDWWASIEWNTVLHATMLHGVLPDRYMPGQVTSFLPPAWSVSLEWQFYLVAPFAFALATSRSAKKLSLLCALCLGCIVIRKVLGEDWYRASLPYHVEFFFLGGASYFLYDRVAGRAPFGTTLVLACMGVFLMRTGEMNWHLSPLAIWMIVMGVLCERSEEPVNRLIHAFLERPLPLFLGEISYSVYLSHYLVFTVLQSLLLLAVPGLPRMVHLGALWVTTVGTTIAVSTLLHRRVELPFIALGKSLTAGSAIPAAVIRRPRTTTNS